MIDRHALLILTLGIVVFIVLAVAIPFAHTAAYWVGVASAVFGFAEVAAAFARAFHKDIRFDSKLLGWPIFKTGGIVMIALLAVSLLMMGLAAVCPLWLAAAVEIVTLSVCAACLTVKDAAREVVVRGEFTVADKTAEWKEIRAKAAAVAAATGDAAIKKLADDIRYADPMPTPLDGDIKNMIEAIGNGADASVVRKAIETVKMRAVEAKAGKTQ